MKTAENYGPNIEVSSAKEPRIHQEAVKTEPKLVQVQRKKRMIIQCLIPPSLSLSSWHFIYLCLAEEVDSFFIRCFSLLDDN